jgi:riboflavin synthase
MFTGLIEAVAEIAARDLRKKAGSLTLRLPAPLTDPVVGESIAVAGVCLTLEEAVGHALRFHALAETFARTNLGRLPVGAKVNLERALRLGDRLGGHLVTGHVDAAAPVLHWEDVGDDLALTVALPTELQAQVVTKGSIAVDGVSLTVVSLMEDRFTVHLIPETRRRTCLAERQVGDRVNLETDLLGKYVLRALGDRPGRERPALDMNLLHRAGW